MPPTEENDVNRIQAFATSLAALALAVGSSPSIAFAAGCEEDAGSVAAHIFDMSDTNSDDHLSPEEFAAGGLERYGGPFDAYDANGDGRTSADEFFDVFDAHHPPNKTI